MGHTTANTHPAGVKAGLTNALYHKSDAPSGENNTPITPGKKDIIIAKTNNKNFFIKKLPLYSVSQYIINNPPTPQERFHTIKTPAKLAGIFTMNPFIHKNHWHTFVRHQLPDF